MQKSTFHIAKRNETLAFGRLLASCLKPKDVVGLCGDLGAGKTFLAGAVAHGLQVPEDTPITSPTFTLIKEYRGRMPVYHMDLYRLGDPSEIYDLGLWEYYDGDGVCLVEWCDRFDDLWPDHALILVLELGEEENRKITASGRGRGGELVNLLTTRLLKQEEQEKAPS
jgi:tRNA threonylcarbamoyladenosine biosynthesis protein TsaE